MDDCIVSMLFFSPKNHEKCVPLSSELTLHSRPLPILQGIAVPNSRRVLKNHQGHVRMAGKEVNPGPGRLVGPLFRGGLMGLVQMIPGLGIIAEFAIGNAHVV